MEEINKKNNHTNCFGCSIKADIRQISSEIKYETRFYRPKFIIPTFLVLIAFISISFSLVEASTTANLTKNVYSTIGLSLAAAIVIIGSNTYLKLQSNRKSLTENVSSVEQLFANKAKKEEMRAKLSKILSKSIQFKTISYDKSSEDENKTDFVEFDNFLKYLELTFPKVFNSKHITVSKINKYSLVLEWKGLSKILKPIMLCAHLDVVPIGNSKDWSISEPFSGKIDKNGFIWGRGSIDNKHNVICQLMALENLLKNGINQPKSTIIFTFGHDEEIGGVNGAKKISEFLVKKYNVEKTNKNVYSEDVNSRNTFDFIFDEGPFLIKGLFPGLKNKPVGIVGCGEKGAVSLKLRVKTYPPGHSSMPRSNGESNVAILSKAITKLESNPFPYNTKMFEQVMLYILDDLPWYLQVIATNMSVFGQIIISIAKKSPAFIASLRTTTAVTIVRVGNKINIVPGEATAYVNHRIHPSILEDLSFDYKSKNTSEEEVSKAILDKVIAYDKRIINDNRVELIYEEDIYPMTPVSPVTSPESEHFDLIKNVIRRVFDSPITPGLMIGNTDTRYYWSLSKNIFRFSPIVFESLEDTKMFHGIDERISSENLISLFEFYHYLISSKV